MDMLRSPGHAQSSYRGFFDVPPCAPGDLSNHSDGARGFLMPRIYVTTPVHVRFAAKAVPQPSGCWEWNGSHHSNGYGLLYVGGKSLYAHRISYELHKGSISVGLTIDHLCRNRECVNPDHLEAVSHRENVLRGTSQVALNATITQCKHGHPFDEANTYIRIHRGNPQRDCRQCHRDRRAQKKVAWLAGPGKAVVG